MAVGLERGSSKARVDTPGDARIALVRRLRARRGEIDQAIFARISDPALDSIGSGDSAYIDGLRAAAVAAVDHVLQAIEGTWEPASEPVPPAALTQARRAARMGVALDTVLRRYIAGYAVLETFILQEVESGELLGRGPCLREALRIASVLVERFIAEVSNAHRQELGARVDSAPTPPAALPERTAATASAVDTSPAEGPGVTPASLVGSRCERVLGAVVEVVAERGWPEASVGLVVARAGVSRRTFYELFPGGLEDGLVAVLDGVLERLGALVWRELEQGPSWQEGVRGALATLLVFFDAEPALARVCFVETLAGGRVVVEHRERVVRSFRGMIVARIEREVEQVPPLAAEGVMASVMGVIYTRLVAGEQEPLVGLLGPLMGTIVTPFLASEQLVAEQARRGAELAHAIQAGTESAWELSVTTAAQDLEPDLSSTLGGPSSRRLRECLCFLAKHPNASNREVAAALGINHKSQISKLLSQLLKARLATRLREHAGAPNAWRLTPRGQELARALCGTATDSWR